MDDTIVCGGGGHGGGSIRVWCDVRNVPEMHKVCQVFAPTMLYQPLVEKQSLRVGVLEPPELFSQVRARMTPTENSYETHLNIIHDIAIVSYYMANREHIEGNMKKNKGRKGDRLKICYMCSRSLTFLPIIVFQFECCSWLYFRTIRALKKIIPYQPSTKLPETRLRPGFPDDYRNKFEARLCYMTTIIIKSAAGIKYYTFRTYEN